jgi:hypothetical protein
MKPSELASAMKGALGGPLDKFATALEANTAATQALLNKTKNNRQLQLNQIAAMKSSMS